MGKLRSLLKLFIVCAMMQLCSSVVYAANKATGVVQSQINLAEKGGADAQYRLGSMYEFGIGTDTDLAKANQWYAEAAKQGYKQAENRITYLEIKKDGFKNKHKDWLKTIKKEAKAGDEESSMLLGQLYSYGLGVDKDLDQSMVYLNNAGMTNPVVFYEIDRVEEEQETLDRKSAQKQKKAKKADKPKKSSAPKAVAKTKKAAPKKLSATELLDRRLAEKAKKRARYEAMMKKLQEEQRILDEQQKWAEENQ